MSAPWYLPVGEVVFILALGAAIASAGWWLTLRAVPRRCETCRPRRGRHEAQPPELEPSTSATGVLHAVTQPAQPPLPRRDPPGWPRADSDGWWPQ